VDKAQVKLENDSDTIPAELLLAVVLEPELSKLQ
jgi:hypothetical protein